ncbi:MAG TPA: CPBP family intramembrane glutamic endopeptidase [Streptosporangiaceae bacterium]|nr:CPBP family intramembrane glutamic endopeptidase [Streptosporangiaceae bacterium]
MALRETSVRPLSPSLIRWEIFAVFAVSLGASALNALLSLIGSLLAPQPLSGQQALLVGSQAANHWLDLALQLATIAENLAPVVLVIYLLVRSDDSPAVIGLDATQPAKDGARGAVLAAIIGGAGLGLYVIAFKLGASLNVVPESLPKIWWRIPVLALYAFQNGMLEETLVLGYLLTRLDQLGVKPRKAVAVSAILRGSYHLYQGFGGFLGNAAMGVIFGVLFRRWRRVPPMIIAHTLIDAGAFIGYAVLHGKVSWLP